MKEVQHSHSPLVSTQWLAQNLDHPRLRVVQCDMSPDFYASGHIPGAVFWHSFADVLLPDMSLNLDPAHFEALMSRSGIEADSLVVFTSEDFVPTAAMLVWMARLFGHADARVLDGGVARWKREERSLERQVATPAPTAYRAEPCSDEERAGVQDVRRLRGQSNALLLDTRTEAEFCGELLPPHPPAGEQRASHIPGALHLPYELALNPNDTFKTPDELRALYASHGVTPDKEIITCCAIGARSAHTWFALKLLLGFPRVRNYDGSWNEWSRLSDDEEESDAAV